MRNSWDKANYEKDVFDRDDDYEDRSANERLVRRLMNAIPNGRTTKYDYQEAYN